MKRTCKTFMAFAVESKERNLLFRAMSEEALGPSEDRDKDLEEVPAPVEGVPEGTSAPERAIKIRLQEAEKRLADVSSDVRIPQELSGAIDGLSTMEQLNDTIVKLIRSLSLLIKEISTRGQQADVPDVSDDNISENPIEEEGEPGDDDKVNEGVSAAGEGAEAAEELAVEDSDVNIASESTPEVSNEAHEYVSQIAELLHATVEIKWREHRHHYALIVSDIAHNAPEWVMPLLVRMGGGMENSDYVVDIPRTENETSTFFTRIIDEMREMTERNSIEEDPLAAPSSPESQIEEKQVTRGNDPALNNLSRAFTNAQEQWRVNPSRRIGDHSIIRSQLRAIERRNVRNNTTSEFLRTETPIHTETVSSSGSKFGPNDTIRIVIPASALPYSNQDRVVLYKPWTVIGMESDAQFDQLMDAGIGIEKIESQTEMNYAGSNTWKAVKAVNVHFTTPGQYRVNGKLINVQEDGVVQQVSESIENPAMSHTVEFGKNVGYGESIEPQLLLFSQRGRGDITIQNLRNMDIGGTQVVSGIGVTRLSQGEFRIDYATAGSYRVNGYRWRAGQYNQHDFVTQATPENHTAN